MQQLLLLIAEIVITSALLGRVIWKFSATKKRINPKNEPEDSHNMVKTGKSNRIQAAREKYRNNMVLIIAFGLTLITLTFFLYADQIVDQHRIDGLFIE